MQDHPLEVQGEMTQLVILRRPGLFGEQLSHFGPWIVKFGLEVSCLVDRLLDDWP